MIMIIIIIIIIIIILYIHCSVHGQPNNMNSYSIPMHPLAPLFLFYSSLIQPCISVHDSIAWMVIYMPGIFLCVFVS